MENLSLEQLMVKKEHLIFDLEAFMKEKGASDGAVMLITPNQCIMTDCFVRRASDLSYGEHGAAINAIYQAIYENPEEVTGTYDRMWQEQVMQDGNGCIQLCNGSSSVVSIPEVVSQAQYLALDWFNNKIKEIYEMNRDYFDVYPMEFVSWGDVSSVNNIDEILASIKVGEVNYKFEDEMVLGNSIKEWSYQLSDNHRHKR